MRKGFSPTLNFIKSAKASDHVTTVMYGGALVHYLIAEAYKNGRFYQQSPALQNNAVSPLLYIRDKGQYRCTST